MANETQSQGVSAETLKAAELNLRETVAKLGNQHPEVLKVLEHYISLLRQAGNNDLADKLMPKAKMIRDLLAKDGQAQAAPSAAEQEAEKARLEAEARAKAEAEKKAELAKKAEQARLAAEQGVFDLDVYEGEDEETMALAMELAQQTSTAAKASHADSADSASPPAKADPDEAVFLFNSKGEHVAVSYRGGLYTPAGQNIGRLLEDYDVFLDRNGWYMGQIVDGNRLARDTVWIHRHLNFGDRGNEGDRAGWGRCADIERTFFERGFEDVEFKD